MQVDDKFLSLVPKALSYLYREGRKGYWIDPVTTSYVALALLKTGETPNAAHLRAARGYLSLAVQSEDTGLSWASELTDTALVSRVLRRLPPERDGLVDEALAWMKSKQLQNGSFDGEPWDSLYVALAGLDANQLELVIPTLEWLVDNQSANGSLLSNHYTGLFCQVLGKALQHSDLPIPLRQRLREAALKSLGFLWNAYDSQDLWGGTTWTNALVIQGMLALQHPQVLGKYPDILTWYEERQLPSGAWEDVVRTAMAVEALWDLRLAIEIQRCNEKQLQELTVEFFHKSTEQRLAEALSHRTVKPPVEAPRKFIDHDEAGNTVITLTRERQLYIGIVAFAASLIWAVLTNWPLVRRLFVR